MIYMDLKFFFWIIPSLWIMFLVKLIITKHISVDTENHLRRYVRSPNNRNRLLLSRSTPRISSSSTRAIKPASHSVENHANNCSGSGEHIQNMINKNKPQFYWLRWFIYDSCCSVHPLLQYTVHTGCCTVHYMRNPEEIITREPVNTCVFGSQEVKQCS